MRQDKAGYRWAILGICWLGYVIALMQRLSIGPLAPYIKEGLNLSHSQVGMLTSAILFGYLLAMVPAGLIVDRVNERYVLTISEIIGGVFICCIFFVPDFILTLVFLCLCGFGLGAILPATTKAILTWFPERERATAMGIKHTAINVGGLIAAVSLPTLALAFTWRHTFLFMGFLGVAVGIISFIFYKPHPSTIIEPVMKNTEKIKISSSLMHVLKNRNILLVTLVGICASMEFAVITYFVLFLKEDLGYAVVTAGFLLAVLEAGGAIGKPCIGFISDRLLRGSRKKAYLLICIIWCLASLVMACAREGQPIWITVPICLILGMSLIGWSGIHFTFVAELGGKDFVGTTTGISTIALVPGAIVWSPLIGKIVDVTGNYTVAWIAIAACGMIGSVLLLFVHEDKDKE
ncbi:MAG: MFS transporter [Syntrophobacteraceae bacterium]